MTPSLVTTLYILRAIVGVFLPVLALAAWPGVADNAPHLRDRRDEGRASTTTKQSSRQSRAP
jgi:hypothetical protein